MKQYLMPFVVAMIAIALVARVPFLRKLVTGA